MTAPHTRPQPWEIAARLEDAAKAVTSASLALDAVYSILLVAGKMNDAREVESIPGAEHVNRDMARTLQALSDRYQAIADAEPVS